MRGRTPCSPSLRGWCRVGRVSQGRSQQCVAPPGGWQTWSGVPCGHPRPGQKPEAWGGVREAGAPGSTEEQRLTLIPDWGRGAGPHPGGVGSSCVPEEGVLTERAAEQGMGGGQQPWARSGGQVPCGPRQPGAGRGAAPFPVALPPQTPRARSFDDSSSQEPCQAWLVVRVSGTEDRHTGRVRMSLSAILVDRSPEKAPRGVPSPPDALGPGQ